MEESVVKGCRGTREKKGMVKTRSAMKSTEKDGARRIKINGCLILINADGLRSDQRLRLKNTEAVTNRLIARLSGLAEC